MVFRDVSVPSNIGGFAGLDEGSAIRTGCGFITGKFTGLACTRGLEGRLTGANGLAGGVVTGETDGLADCAGELVDTTTGTSKRPTLLMASKGPVLVFLVDGILLDRN